MQLLVNLADYLGWRLRTAMLPKAPRIARTIGKRLDPYEQGPHDEAPGVFKTTRQQRRAAARAHAKAARRHQKALERRRKAA